MHKALQPDTKSFVQLSQALYINMNNKNQKALALFFSITIAAIFTMLVILFFSGNGENINAVDVIGYMYTENNDKPVIISLTMIMLILIAITALIIKGKINTKNRAKACFYLTIATILLTLYLQVNFFSLIILPALIYSYLNIQNV